MLNVSCLIFILALALAFGIWVCFLDFGLWLRLWSLVFASASASGFGLCDFGVALFVLVRALELEGGGMHVGC